MSCYEGDYEWQPPSEAEMKLIEARKERSDKISKLMGDYMLKGYKMLNAICSSCDTILLEDKQGKKYCVACIDLASDTHKDDPALSAQAALSKVLEHQRGCGSKAIQSDSSDHTNFPKADSVMLSSSNLKGFSTSTASQHSVVMPSQEDVQPQSVTNRTVEMQSDEASPDYPSVKRVLCDKIHWATCELRRTTNVDYCIQLCQLIKASTEAILALRTCP